MFISGMFVIPAGKEKVMENCGENCLIGVVLECESDCIVLSINQDTFFLQKSDVFWVPKKNEYFHLCFLRDRYSILNKSKTRDAKFVYVNIKSDC